MQLVDTHCHIHESGTSASDPDHTQQKWLAAGNPSPRQLVQSAHDAGVTRLVCVGCALSDSKRAVDFAQAQPQVWASIGIHPHEAKLHTDAHILEEFAALVTQPKVVAIGETGLDYYYNHSDKPDQIAVLEFQLQLAADHNLPVIFHVRQAYDDFWSIFANFPGLTGVLHSFTDSTDNMYRAIKHGLHIGVNGIATFTKDNAQKEMFAAIPLSNLLLETDAPYLTPTPVRGTINEPKNVTYITEYLAELRGETAAAIADATTTNAIKLFRLT
jgi:TatD DNase family protein